MYKTETPFILDGNSVNHAFDSRFFGEFRHVVKHGSRVQPRLRNEAGSKPALSTFVLLVRSQRCVFTTTNTIGLPKCTNCR